MAQIGGIKPTSKLDGQRLPQLHQQTAPICGALCSALLKLNNVLPNVPIGLHLHHINRTQHLLA
jgi:hypothetical protein